MSDSRSHWPLEAVRSEREVQLCPSQPVSSDSMFSLAAVVFFLQLFCWLFRVQTVATAMSATGGEDTTPTFTRADAHFSHAHITVHNSPIDPHFSNVVTSALAESVGVINDQPSCC